MELSFPSQEGEIGKATYQRVKVELYEKIKSERKWKVPKSNDKSSQIQKRKQLTKEGVVSFWRLIKYVIGKEGNI